MEPMVVMLMEKEQGTGYLIKEIGSYRVMEGGAYIDAIYLIEKVVHLRLTTDRDLEDWEYAAVFDYYDTEVFGQIILSINEVEEEFNPVWEITFPFTDSQEGMENLLERIITIHKTELNSTYEGIQDKKEEYE
ncbi:DUF6762 family protein [Geosporobacter ferrireducens]|uniref:Uncharacterized protein n=1 Tax=Geosporobacter ferrireducens TaxID=1424294 RepID=A0A1D8GMR4_9FIRM|nr:DUF6762 family protein [Geosporobacter ferrireducens]AOT72180.1 hypothetical protein Gferi_23135 [Geosporobacter ferrireducens]MTI56070.1 hypothetical protein [Geosporobacter ferrireducens]